MLEWLARRQWFFFDDFDFLSRNLSRGNVPDALFRSHNGHWSTVPTLVFQALASLFGIGSYLPYMTVLIVLHLLLALLLGVVMVRAGVDKRVTVALCAIFVFFGAVRHSLFWATNIGFVSAIVLGLCQLLLADHEGVNPKRDVGAIACGAVGLMCSGIALPMTAAVGLATLLRRGWPAARGQVLPLGALYLIWQFAYATVPGGTIGDLFAFTGKGLNNSVNALTHIPYAAIPVFVLIALFFVNSKRSELRGPQAAVLALTVGAVVFFVTTAIGRAALLGVVGAKAERYEYVGAALLIPAIGVTVTRLQKRRALVAIMASVGLFALISNLALLMRLPSDDAPAQQTKETVLAAADVIRSQGLTSDAASYPVVLGLTFQQLRALITDGIVPRSRVADAAMATARGLLAVQLLPASRKPPPLTADAPQLAGVAHGHVVGRGNGCAAIVHDGNGPLFVAVSYPQAQSAWILPERIGRAPPNDIVDQIWRGPHDKAASYPQHSALRPGQAWTLQVHIAGYLILLRIPSDLNVTICSIQPTA